MIVLHIPSWFPKPEKPLDGNFILRQIATVSADTTSIILRHTEKSFLPKCSEFISDNIIFHSIITNRGKNKISLLRAYDEALQQIIQQHGKPDIIHLHVALPLGMAAVILSNKYRIPLIVSEHWSIYQPQNRSQLSLKQRIQLQLIYRQASYLTTVSENLHHAITETVPIAQRIPFRCVSNVVNTTVFQPTNAIENANFGKQQILHISTLDQHAKNILGILRVTKKLAKQRNDFELNIIHDLQNEEVEQYIKHNHLEKIVHLLGKKSESEVAAAIQSCAFMLQFSNYENQPCVLLESFCCGKPIVATTVGGIPEIATEENARLVKPRDEEALLEQLNFMLDHAIAFKASEISQDAHKKYAPQVIGAQFLEIYHQLIR